MSNERTILLLFAPSCTGKTTFISYLKEQQKLSSLLFDEFTKKLDLDIDSKIKRYNFKKWINSDFKDIFDSKISIIHYDILIINVIC